MLIWLHFLFKVFSFSDMNSGIFYLSGNLLHISTKLIWKNLLFIFSLDEKNPNWIQNYEQIYKHNFRQLCLYHTDCEIHSISVFIVHF